MIIFAGETADLAVSPCFFVHFYKAALFFVVQTNGTLWTRFAVLAAIPLLLYNGQRGRKSKWYQWGYYLIYPIHFMVLYVIELLVR
ncbi:MAG: TraX family protein [Oscillospiraceae bacterium]